MEAEIVGEHFSIFYTTNNIDEGVPEQNLETVVREGRVEGWRVRKDESQFWANVTITTIRNDDGELQGFAKVTRDMTDIYHRQSAVEAAVFALHQRYGDTLRARTWFGQFREYVLKATIRNVELAL